VREHDYEPVWGLPERLPDGETILWQGKPEWWNFAWRALHLPVLAAYFGVLVVARIVSVLMAGASVAVTARDALWFIAPSLGVLGLVLLLAWGIARTTAYTITSQRVVLRFGIALPMTVNLPFSVIHSAAAKVHADGTGDISLKILPPHRVSYLFFWPHARPWHYAKPQPTLRGIADAAVVAQVLARALAGAAAVPVQAALQGVGRPVKGADVPQPQAA
jgi:hypothetical protein